MVDDYTLRHLGEWIEARVHPLDREEVLRGILALLQDDPTLADLGWTRLRDMAQ